MSNKKQNCNKKILPFPAGSHLVQRIRGKNKGKYAVYGLECVQNSLMRFANVPFYIMNQDGSKTHGSAFTTKEKAQEFHDSLVEHCKPTKPYFIIEILLTEDQIVK